MTVPLLDLQAQYRSLKPALDAALIRVAESQVCILGEEVEALERSMAAYCGCRFALGVSSGTDALLMALMALDVGVGDEVIVPTYSFFATAGAVARLGAVPVLVDSEARAFNLDPALLEQHITPRTKAIVPVHLFGQAAEMNEIMAIANAHSIPVIEDAAQAIGSQYKDGRKAGGIGHVGCFSFYPTKNLGAFGDAGLVTTNDETLYTTMKQLRNHGMEPKYHHKLIGGNFRMDALQAAVLNVKFPHLEAWHEARRQNAALYTQLFTETGFAGDDKAPLQLPEALFEDSGVKNYHIYNQYTIRASRRDALREHLSERGIGSEIYYPVPFHRQECFAYVNAADSEFPVANSLAAHALSLSVYPELTPEQIEYVVREVAGFYQR